MRTVLLGVAVATSLVLAMAGPAAAMGTLDQSYEPSSGFINGSSAVQFGEAQVFTAGISGVLDTVALDGASSECPGITHTVQIRSVTAEGEPVGSPDDSSGVLADQTLECTAGFYNITFAHPPVVVAGQQYAIVFGLDGSTIYHELVEPAGGYAGGAACGWNVGVNPPVWNCDFGGDWLFRTYVSPTPLPDARIRKRSGSYVGNNIYNTDALSQSVSGAKAIRRTLTFYVSIQNDGQVTDSFTVRCSGIFNDGYKVRFFDAANDITGLVSAGNYITPTLAPGSTYVIRATVRVLARATPGSSVSRLVTVSSTAFPDFEDAVRFTAERK